jgi:hypothetical protein
MPGTQLFGLGFPGFNHVVDKTAAAAGVGFCVALPNRSSRGPGPFKYLLLPERLGLLPACFATGNAAAAAGVGLAAWGRTVISPHAVPVLDSEELRQGPGLCQPD